MEMELKAYLVQFFAQFFLGEGKKKKKKGNKKKKEFTQIGTVARFLIFQMQIWDISNDCKSNVSARASKLHNWTLFRLEKKLQAYLVGLPGTFFNEMENENTHLRKLADV